MIARNEQRSVKGDFWVIKGWNRLASFVGTKEKQFVSNGVNLEQ